MSDISVRGYVNKPATKNGSKGAFSTFTLSEKQKNKPGEEATKNFFNVTNFESVSPPEESAYVEVTGWLKFRKYVSKEGQERVSYDVVAKSVAPYSGGPGVAPTGETAGSEPKKDPWE